MALVPGCQLHFDSFQSSFSKFNVTSLQFFRYNSSFPLKARTPYAYSLNDNILPRKSSFLATDKSASQQNPIAKSSTTCNWFSKWNKPNKQNHPQPPQAVFNYRYSDNSCTGGTTMEKIVEKLKKHGYIDERMIEKGSVEDIFYVEEEILPNSRGGYSSESPLGVEDLSKSNGEVRFPWEKPIKEENEDERKWTAGNKSSTALAELTLPESKLRRLRNLKWKTSEIVRVKVEGAPALNMRRMHETLERKTGGLVIWRSGTSVWLYRGVSYEVPSVQLSKWILKKSEISTDSLPATAGKLIRTPSKFASSSELDVPQSNSDTTAEGKEKKETGMLEEVKYEDEVNKLLEGLGPRYTDWPGLDPLPVDADLLPGIVPVYQPPIRILPYGVRSTLGQKVATSLGRLARVLPPHFALGERIFLSPDVSEALLERERLAKSLQDKEQQARLKASALVIQNSEIMEKSGTAGTLEETLDADAKWGNSLDDNHREKIMREVEIARHANLVRKLESKLVFALMNHISSLQMKVDKLRCEIDEADESYIGAHNSENEGNRYPETFDGENEDEDDIECDDLAQDDDTKFNSEMNVLPIFC
ncbi:hypothetical protein P3X46_027573 [Hevea brasiliensis]|uniref:CRM domain-containing protein n=1 Tax=Hevea brasiliensis TaxID=3981 RepID=A0ABQ9L1S4_HEVBR|nr:hypothetical protein P3X46_027573 [Hevea brasiliensis]